MGRIDLPDKTTGSVVVTREYLNRLYDEIIQLRIEIADALELSPSFSKRETNTH